MNKNKFNQRLHTTGRQWFTVSATVLALLGVGSLANKNANADSFKDNIGNYSNAQVNIQGMDNSTQAKLINGFKVGDIEGMKFNSQLIKSKIAQSPYKLDSIDADANKKEVNIHVSPSNKRDLSNGKLKVNFLNKGSSVGSKTMDFNVSNVMDSLNYINDNAQPDSKYNIDTSQEMNLKSKGNNNYTANIAVKPNSGGSAIIPGGGSSNNNSSNNNKQNNNQSHNQNNNSKNNNNSNIFPSNDNSHKNNHSNNHSNNSQSKGKNANNVKKAQKSVTKAKAVVKQAHSKKARAKAEKQLKSAQKQVKQEVKINKASNNVQKAKAALKNAHGKKARAKAQKQLKKVQKALYKASGIKKYNKNVNKAKKQLRKAHSKKARAKAEKQLKQANAQLKEIKKMF